MPNIKSAKKRVLVNGKNAVQNKAVRSELKTVLKKADFALENKADNSAEAVKLAIKKIDQAAAKGILHKNNASRKKSGLVCKLNRVG